MKWHFDIISWNLVRSLFPIWLEISHISVVVELKKDLISNHKYMTKKFSVFFITYDRGFWTLKVKFWIPVLLVLRFSIKPVNEQKLAWYITWSLSNTFCQKSTRNRSIKNKLFFIQIYFIAFKVGSSRNNTLMPTNNPIIKTFFKRIFQNRPVLAANSLYVFYRLKTGASKW